MRGRRAFRFAFRVGVGAALWLAGGCSAIPGDPTPSNGGGDARPAAGTGAGEGVGATGGAGDDLGGGFLDEDRNVADADGDGFTVAEGDCNDRDRNVNPGAIEVATDGPDEAGNAPVPVDEDCDGLVDNVLPPCDGDIAPDDFDAMRGANAIDLCAVASPNDRRWGVLRARYVRGDGSPAEPTPAVGVLDAFGPNVRPQGGARMLALSSGRARAAHRPGACGAPSCASYGPGRAPPGFPQDNPSCPPSSAIHDDIGLEIVLRAPTNATGYEFSFKFYTFEYPEYVCDSFNDQFLALATPPPPGSRDGNLSFDSLGNPVSVNIGFFEVCEGCPLGADDLVGTGFGLWNDAGATRWLRTRAPVTGGEEITLRFMIFDTGDDMLDSTALIDGFRWIASGGTVAVETTPIETPR